VILIPLPDRAKDKICIFGFSRGAYTARALAGMIHKVWLCPPTRYFGSLLTSAQVGLLPTGNRQQVPFAYKMYTLDDDFGWKQSGHFKQAFSVDVKVDFLGAWWAYSIQTLIRQVLQKVTHCAGILFAPSV